MIYILVQTDPFANFSALLFFFYIFFEVVEGKSRGIEGAEQSWADSGREKENIGGAAQNLGGSQEHQEEW